MRVLTWNLWLAGNCVEDARPKQLRFLREVAPDVVGLQETIGTAARELAEELGWAYHQGGSCGIITPHPIVERYGDDEMWGVGARLRLPETDVVVWSAHLNYTPYGPYDVLAGMSTEQVLAREEESGRPEQIRQILAEMAPALAEPGLPVLLLGDFNTPSHLDWPLLPWPVSGAVTEAGLYDAYRMVHPDPVAEPGHTWSPIVAWHEGQPGVPEPQDRIDFIHAAGPLRPLDVRTVLVGEPAPAPDHAGNEWTSDHRAVLGTFAVAAAR